MNCEKKKIAFLGDRITLGDYLDEDLRYVTLVKKHFPWEEFYNYSVSGSRIGDYIGKELRGIGPSFVERYLEMPDNMDLVVVFGGTDDFGIGNEPLGSREDYTTQTFYGALNVLLTGLKKKYEHAHIIYMTPMHRMDEKEPNAFSGAVFKDYIEAIKDRVKAHEVLLLDLYGSPSLQPTEEYYESIICEDGIYPNEIGHQRIAAELIAYLEKIRFIEEKKTSEPYKKQYLEGIKELVNRLEQKATKNRETVWKDIMANKEKYRSQFAEVLGWPLTQARECVPCEVISEKLYQEKDCIVERMQFTVLDDIVITGLFFRHDEDTRRPFVLAQHGGFGTPELVAGLYGSTSNYNDMLERIFEQGANVFAPQLLIWSQEKYKIEYNRPELDARLKNIGSSITALEIYFLMRILDYFEVQPWVKNIGMVGLSYGGFFTQFMTALDTRIKAAISCSFFCDAAHRVRTDWSWRDFAKTFGEAELACLVHPRKLFLEIGNMDEIFDYQKSVTEYQRITQICADDNEKWLEFTIFDGNHEFYKDNKHIEKFMDYLLGEEV